MAIAHEVGRARCGDVSIHYRRLGRPGRTPLLIVHGLSYFSYDWLPAAEALGTEREVVAMDMRGFGDSDWSAQKDYSVSAMAQDIVCVLDHLGWPRAALVGHSMGGRSTTYAAAKHPGRIAGLVLVDYSPENARRIFDRLAAPQLHLGCRQKNHLTAKLADADFERNPRAGGRFREKHGPDLAGQRLG